MWKRFLALVGVVTAIYAAMAYAIDINGQLKRAQLEQLSSDPTGTLARIYYNTTTNQGRVYNGSVWNVFGNAAGQIPGTATDDTASAGNVGEVFGVNGTAIAPSNGAYVVVASQVLTPGHWAVQCHAEFTNGTITGLTLLEAGISLNDATGLDVGNLGNRAKTAVATINPEWDCGFRTVRLNSGATAAQRTIRLMGRADFATVGTSTFTTASRLEATRVR